MGSVLNTGAPPWYSGEALGDECIAEVDRYDQEKSTDAEKD